ncbi:Glycosyl transferase family 2 [Dyadobacter sp. SG02]|uniref:glycosyltransferase family 2 protein n=1 Tax=Dyadobacter sp. SG02 TaxID=1855291 RepID=UPI0008C214F6|nr:glycosyltransferase family 2 protein [Dyadobacter sp. SG02]SEJ39067.1 Glycosyl transferase family 2 [Dyadobacter sp. SG02]
MLVSICIPTYSRLDYLKQAVQSCLDQSFRDIEICVSQDPKKDGPDRKILEWCSDRALELPFFKFNLNTQNLGLAGNWNECVEMASGKYIIIIGDDDLLAPDFVRIMAEKAERFLADVAFCNQHFIDGKGEVLDDYTEETNALYHRNNLGDGPLPDAIAVVLRNSVPMSAALIRRDLLVDHPFDTSLNTPEFEVFLKIAVGGGVFAYHSGKLASYRVHPLAATSSGLTIDKLLRNVIRIDVPAQYQQLKYDFVSTKIVPGINICLRKGDRKQAFRLITSRYYPRRKLHIKLIQTFILALPHWAIKKIL